MTINIDGSPFLKHLTKFNNITDTEIEPMAISEYGGLDAEECLMLYLERDFCQGIVKSVIKELEKLN